MLKVGTTFSGIGAPEQALKNLKIPHIVKWASDNNKFCKETYFANHFCDKWYEDISSIDIDEMEYVDLYVFGFPCQSVSIAGNQNLADGRTTLVEYSLNIIDKINPKYLIYENVKGLLQNKFATFYNYINKRLSNNYSYAIKVLNSKNFGVPHNRERVFFVGIRKDLGLNPCIPAEKKTKFANDCQICECCGEPYCEDCSTHYSECKCSGPNSENHLENILEANVKAKYYLSDVCIERIERITERAKTKGFGYKSMILNKDSLMQNLDASYYKGPDGKRGVIKDSKGLRMLTPRECARVHGFADDFVIPVSDMQAYKQFGNTITVPILEEIIKVNVK